MIGIKGAIAAAGVMALFVPSAMAWIPEVETDKLDGSKTLLLWRNSSEGAISPHRRPSKSVTGKFAIVCKKGAATYFVFVEDELVAGSTSRVDYRIGDQPPVRGRRWEASADRTAIGSFNKATTATFLKSVSKAETLFVRVTDDVFGVTELTFDTSGLADELKGRVAECGKMF